MIEFLFQIKLFPVPTILFLPRATKLRQGNVFTPVCYSVHRGSGGGPLSQHAPQVT